MTANDTSIERRTYWLSFCDGDRPEGQQFLGACVVDVTATEAAAALALKPDMYNKVDGPWLLAAARKDSGRSRPRSS